MRVHPAGLGAGPGRGAGVERLRQLLHNLLTNAVEALEALYRSARSGVMEAV